MKLLLKLTASVAVAMAIHSCAGPVESSSQSYPLSVTVSIEPQRQMLEAIGGDRVSVSSLLAGGGDPETYDPTLASLVHLEQSAAWFQIGNMPFEDELTRKIGSKLKCVDTSEGVELIEGTHDCGHDDHEHEHHHGHDHSGGDPHTWSSVRNLKIMARKMKETLTEIDPSGASYYKARYDSVANRLDSLDKSYGERLSRAADKAFMVWHPSLSYFARDYGLRQISVSADHRETSLLSLQSTIDKAIDEGVKVFFEQSSYDPRLSATVKRHIGAVCVTFNPLEYDWQRGLDAVVEALEQHAD